MNQWELPQYEHIKENMNISEVLLLGWPYGDKIVEIWLGWVIDQVSDRIQDGLINLPKPNVQVSVSIIVLGHFIAPGCLCLWLVGSGERAGPNTH